MNESKKNESGSISKKHFSKLHERIQNKYAQMQQRLEKSRSMESISALNEEFATEQWSSSSKRDTQLMRMMRDEEPEKVKSDSDLIRHSVTFEDVNKQDAVIDIIQTILHEPHNNGENVENDDDVFIEHGTSLENLYEQTNNNSLAVDIHENRLNSSPSKRVKVGGRIRAAIERRREHKKWEKMKKFETIGGDSPDDKKKLSVLHEPHINGENVEVDDYAFIELGTSLENIYEQTNINSLVDIHEDRLHSSPSKRVTVGERIVAALERRREHKKWEKKKKFETIGDDSPDDKIVLSNSKRKNKVASVVVALIEANGLDNEPAVEERARLLYCRIRLGQEKEKSKLAKINENVASWQELFHFYLHEDNFLEITLLEKDVIIGRVVVDLSELEYDKTHKMELRLEEQESVDLLILITISATVRENNETDQTDNEIKRNEIMEMQNHVSRLLLNDDFANVGMLHITVHKAMGLATSDCFAAFIIGNERRQTHTENKTHNPEWMRSFTFDIKDASSVLYVTIYDEKKSDIVGRLAILLLNIKNGEPKWYALKDATYANRAKGNNPRILLEMSLYFNYLKQSLRLINPKERIYLQAEPEFSRHRLAINIKRLRVVINWIKEVFKITKGLFEWENKKLNLVALIGWLIFWYFFEIWMLPLFLLIPFYYYRPEEYQFNIWIPKVIRDSIYSKQECSTLQRTDSLTSTSSNISEISTVSSTSTVEKSGKPRTSLMQKLQSVGEMVKTAQNEIGNAASLSESVKNLFNFTVPFISIFSIIGILATSVFLYYAQIQYILMGWGVHKYLRKILRPNRIPNNEIMDLISRVPDDVTMFECKEIPVLQEEETPQDITDKDKKRKLSKDKGI